MSYATEASAIETYLKAGITGIPVGFEKKGFGNATTRIEAHIQNGDVLQGSIGRIADRIDNVGVLQLVIYTGPDANANRRTYAETIETLFRGKRIKSDGTAVGSGDTEFIRFSPQDQHPYIASNQNSGGEQRTVMNVPFVRYEFK